MKLVGIQFLKGNVFCPGTNSGAFFLLVENIVEIRRNTIFQKYYRWGKIIPASGQLSFWQVETIISEFIRDSYQWQIFFRLTEKYFSTKSFIPAWSQKKKFLLVETDFLARGNRFLLLKRFSSCWKPSLKLVEANCKSIF